MAAAIGALPAAADVPAAAAAIAGRGPDGTATWADAGLTLAASRLAHWDEGAPRQPFVGDDGAAAAFNGELFDLAELQAALGRPGLSEVEALVVGLREEGSAFLRRIDGQFAAVVRLRAGGPTLLVRDRFGIAPLYWARVGGTVVAASNLAALLALRGEVDSGATEFDLAGLGDVLAQWAPVGDRSPYRGVAQVRPGHLLVVENDGTVREESWFDPAAVLQVEKPASAPSAGGDFVLLHVENGGASSFGSTGRSDAVSPADAPAFLPAREPAGLDELEAALRRAVAVRTRSTGRVACLLSGGIDSTVIGGFARDEGIDLGLALTLEGDDLVTGRQREVAAALDMTLVQHVLTPAETVEAFEAYVTTRRMPLVRLGPVGMMALARRARREGIRGVLSGEGADELFAGYDSYRILAGRAGLLGPVKGLTWGDFGAPEFGADRGERWARQYWRSMIALSASAGARRADILRPVAEALRPPLRGVVTGDAPTQLSEVPADPLEARRALDLATLLAGYLLTVQGDHAWLEEGVELRPPYLATPVAQWALARPVGDFVAVGNGKLPVRALLPRLARRRPALAGLGFAKAAFRVDAGFVLRDPAAFDRLAGWATRCPEAFLDREFVCARVESVRRAGTCSEAESELLVFAASLGLLAA